VTVGLLVVVGTVVVEVVVARAVEVEVTVTMTVVVVLVLGSATLDPNAIGATANKEEEPNA